jgi:hypothetical protein
VSLHRQRTHPIYVETCFGCRVSTVRLNMSDAYKGTEARERDLRADLDAYKRLRNDGLQPPNIDGAADLERTATTRLQVEHPKVAPYVEAFQ